MERRDLETLEFPKILEQLAGHTAFSASRALALELLPATDPSEVERRLLETGEARRLQDVKPGISIGGARDVRPLLEDCRRRLALAPTQFLDIKATLLAGRSLSSAILRLGEQFPRLADIAGRIEECRHVVLEISRCINEHAEVMDDASPALGRIRRELRQARDRLIERLNHMISSSDASLYLQEALITQRNGRFVIPLKAEFKGRIPGLVHDQSASGATLFIEPLATVELNNQCRSLQIEEENEVRRILAALSDLVAAEAGPIERTVMGLAELDLAFAKANYGIALRAVPPEFVPLARPRSHAGDQALPHPGVTLDLRRARHPLLDPATVVPIDVRLTPNYFILIVTGPNTGGKTVALKTVGLLVAMSQAGLAIPVEEGSRLSVFENVFADIGDEQSIEQSLSTFSAHLTNIVRILAEATSRSLVLLDELGAGTDPEEGSALARAILSHMLRRGVSTFATTHYSELKLYAHATAGVQNASVEFNLESLSPTYELTIGLPGRSNAFAIARRLGLPDGIIQEAAGLVSTESMEAEQLLAEIKATQVEITEERQRAIQVRQETEALRRELQVKLGEIEAARREVLEEARHQARWELDLLGEEIEQLREQARSAHRLAAGSEERHALTVLESTLDELSEDWTPLNTQPAPAESEPWRQPKLGDTVWVEPLRATAEVTDLTPDEVEVQAGSFRLRVPIRAVTVRRSAPARMTDPIPPRQMEPTFRPTMELDLRGMRVEDALIDVEKYLDDAYLSNLPWARIIHGKGTGVLRQVIRERLREHPLVASQRSGEDKEGGEGVTVVTFRKS